MYSYFNDELRHKAVLQKSEASTVRKGWYYKETGLKREPIVTWVCNREYGYNMASTLFILATYKTKFRHNVDVTSISMDIYIIYILDLYNYIIINHFKFAWLFT